MTDYAPLLASLRELQTKVKLDARHCYWKDKARVPGVTSIIRVLDAPKLDEWKVRVQVEGTARAAHANPPVFGEDPEMYVSRLVEIAKEQFEHERIADQAANVGTQVHALIEHAVKTQLGEECAAPDVSDEALFIFAGWREWAESVGLKPLMAEGRVHNEVGYCGSFDLLAVIEDRLAILDWKPSPAVYPERRLQSVAYREALHQMGAPPVDGYIVSLPRDGGEITPVKLEAPASEEFMHAYAAFLSCLSLYQWNRMLERQARRKVSEAA